MKKNFIGTVLLAALLLTGCEREQEQLIDEFTIKQTGAATAVTGGGDPSQTTLVGLAEGKAETDKAEKLAVTEAEVYEKDGIKMRWFNYGQLYPALDETLAGRVLFKGDIMCIENTVRVEGELSPEKLELVFFDIKENSFLRTVEITGGWNTGGYIEGYGDIFCKVLLYRRKEDENGEFLGFDNAIAIVRDDYTYEIADYTPENAAFEHYGHHIAEWGVNIVDTDSGEVIVQGFVADEGQDEYGFMTEAIYYEFPIDENRFVYRIGGYERLPGFGVYDFETGTASKVPESENLVPVGYSDGYIYAVKTVWDGFGTELYRTDANTLETEFYMDYTPVFTSTHVSYEMPPDGSYIAILTEELAGSDNDEMFYIVDIKTGEQRKAVIPERSQVSSGVSYSGGGEAVITNWWGKLLLISVSDAE